MGSIRDIQNPWRAKFQQASFRGAIFHVEVGMQAGGRRVALHEYPKKNEPYAEDMGRRARRFTVTGYLIGPRYLDAKDRLVAELDKDGPGILRMPFPIPGGKAGELKVMNVQYQVVESRERGGMCGVEMDFVEAGEPGNTVTAQTINPQAAIASAAQGAEAAVAKPDLAVPPPAQAVDPVVPLPSWTQTGLIPSGGWDVSLGRGASGSW